jgi:hypothetical protein
MDEIVRINRITKAEIAICDFFGVNDWALCCNTHGRWTEMPNKTQALSWMAEPWVFCSECAEIKEEKS